MRLLIDGSNFLHAPMPTPLAGLDERALCRLLAMVGPGVGWRGAVVVCDGTGRHARPPAALPGARATFLPKPQTLDPKPSPPEAGVELVFSGKGKSADDVIVERIDGDSAPRRMVVVSDDHAIQRAARRRGAKVWACSQLAHGLLAARRAPVKTHPPGKPGGGPLDDAEVRRWAKEFGLE